MLTKQIIDEFKNHSSFFKSIFHFNKAFFNILFKDMKMLIYFCLSNIFIGEIVFFTFLNFETVPDGKTLAYLFLIALIYPFNLLITKVLNQNSFLNKTSLVADKTFIKFVNKIPDESIKHLKKIDLKANYYLSIICIYLNIISVVIVMPFMFLFFGAILLGVEMFLFVVMLCNAGVNLFNSYFSSSLKCHVDERWDDVLYIKHNQKEADELKKKNAQNNKNIKSIL